jgi:GDP-L-fucose synthase
MNLAQSEYERQTQPMLSHINVGFGSDISIKELAQTISDVVGFRGYLEFDPSKPDGSPRKLMDSSRLNALGWSAKVGLVDGLKMAYQDFLTQLNHSNAN